MGNDPFILLTQRKGGKEPSGLVFRPIFFSPAKYGGTRHFTPDSVIPKMGLSHPLEAQKPPEKLHSNHHNQRNESPGVPGPTHNGLDLFSLSGSVLVLSLVRGGRRRGSYTWVDILGE